MRLQRIGDAVFRILFSLIFIGAGLKHLMRPEDIVERLAAMPLSYLATSVAGAPVLVFLTGVVLLVAGLGLLLGGYSRLSAVALIVVLVPITITVDLGHTDNLGPLFKNIALLGGLIHFSVRGGGPLALDRLRDSSARCVS